MSDCGIVLDIEIPEELDTCDTGVSGKSRYPWQRTSVFVLDTTSIMGGPHDSEGHSV